MTSVNPGGALWRPAPKKRAHLQERQHRGVELGRMIDVGVVKGAGVLPEARPID